MSSIACEVNDSTPDKSTQKRFLRSALLATRQTIAHETKLLWDQKICTQVTAWAHTWHAKHPGAVLGVYWPINKEPDLHFAYTELVTSGISLALPVVQEKNQALRFAAWTPGDLTILDAYKVPIPVYCVMVAPQALLIPCVGFNPSKIRLGYGGGFYDRTLAQTTQLQTVGIAYSLGLAEFDAAAHDMPLDTIITETGAF